MPRLPRLDIASLRTEFLPDVVMTCLAAVLSGAMENGLIMQMKVLTKGSWVVVISLID